MGQAKLRGTLEQRAQNAQDRFSQLSPEEQARALMRKKSASVQRRIVRAEAIKFVTNHVLSMTGMNRSGR